MQVWMAVDPETSRVFIQTHELTESDFPRGPRGQGWPRRVAEVPSGLVTAMLNSSMPPEQQDHFHRKWWDDARQEGEPLWPQLLKEGALP